MKKSFILYTDQRGLIKKLTNEEAGKLLKAMYDYQADEKLKLDRTLQLVFEPFKQTFLRDKQKYDDLSEKRSLYGSQGGKKSAEIRWGNVSKNNQKTVQEENNVPNSVSKNKHKLTGVSKITGSDSDSDNKEINKENIISSKNLKTSQERAGLSPDFKNKLWAELERASDIEIAKQRGRYDKSQLLHTK